MINRDRINEIKSLLLLSASLLIFVSLISYTPTDLVFYTSRPNLPAQNLARIFGAKLAGSLFFTFGWACFLFPLFFLLWAKDLFEKKSASTLRLSNFISLLIFFISLSSFFSLFGNEIASSRFSRGGLVGLLLSDFLLNYFGHVGSAIILLTFIVISFILAEEMLFLPILLKISDKINALVSRWPFNRSDKRASKPKFEGLAKDQKAPPVILKPRADQGPNIKVANLKQPAIAKTGDIKPDKKEEELIKPVTAKTERIDYKLPGLDLLDDPPAVSARQLKEDLNANARILEETLADFSISVRVTDIERGPVITRYELEPAPGVKLQRIVTLSDDIALAMKATSVRIVAPIPGKARVGIEVPNSSTSIVYFQELAACKEFMNSSSKLALSVGKDIAGQPVIADLTQMPHLLIAGTTGSGKTVCINSLIMSLLFKHSPDEVKLIMVDPKMVELAPFNSIPHLLCPVVTAANKVSGALNWLVLEMERRYRVLAEAGVRNIELFNSQTDSAKLPYIIVIIDELADLMAVAANHIESAITRLAQLSRAVGIHLILATQRPSVDVITGVIKANFPARISFQVASKVDSRTVLDMNGADKLLGKGDLLFLKPGESKLIRAQGCFIKDSEIERVVQFIDSQAKPEYNEEVLKNADRLSGVTAANDELFDEAVRMVLESNQASVSILQRRMRLGYTRAARLIDAMEEKGIVGPFQGSKPREILVDRESWLKKDMQLKEENE
jgi:S-DNA-T family DNA segregation ATPase FtsK/SpoIIIE